MNNIDITDLLSNREIVRLLEKSITNSMNLSEEDKKYGNPKTWHSVKKKISDIMETKVKGRPYPQKQKKAFTNWQATKLTKDPIFDYMKGYPKNCKTDKQKLYYLIDLYTTGSITVDICVDLMSVLDLSEVIK